MALLSLRERAGAVALLEEVRYVELSDRSDFNDRFIDRCRSPADTAPLAPAVAVIACGALAAHIREIMARRSWRVELHCLPAVLHNRPEKITPYAERLALSARSRGLRVVLAYADCGTYVLSDFLVRGFRRLVLGELGLDRRPELWADYFGHYRRVVWLAQRREADLEAEAAAVAAMFQLPLTVIDVGTSALELELEQLVCDE